MATPTEAIGTFTAATQQYVAGDLAGALARLAEAEALARAAGDGALVAAIVVQKAGWLREAGRADEARAALEAAEAGLDRLPASERGVVLAGLRMERGIVAMRAGDFARAEQFLAEAEREATGQPWGPAILSDILANLASVHLYRGDLEAAQTTLARAIVIDREIGNTRALSNDLNLLSMVYSVSGDRETAALYLKEALAIAGEGGFVREAADALTNLSIELEEAGQLEEAEAGYESAFALYRQIGNQEEIANIQSSLGIVAAKRGDPERAHRLHLEALALHRQIGSVVPALHDLLNLVQVELNMGDPQSALSRVLEVAAEAERLGLPDLLWRAHWLTARAYSARLSALADPRQQVQVLNDEVLPAYARAADAVELLRTGIGRPEEREQLLWDKESLYGEAMLLAGMLSQKYNALVFSERARARAFLDLMGAARLQRGVAEHPLLERRERLISRLAGMEEIDPDRARPLLEELRRLRAEIRADEPRIAAITDSLPGFNEILGAIPPKTALVEFFLGPGRHLGIFVLTGQGIARLHVSDLGQFDLRATIAQFRTELENEVEGVPSGYKLFLILFSQVWDTLAPMERLLIVPHRELHYVPFGATWFKNAGPGPEKIYLSQYFTLSVLPSAAFLPICLKLPRPPFRPGNARVLGNPTSDLPDAEREASIVASHLGTAPLVREQATRAALLDAPPNLAVVHVASHGVYHELDPLLSGVVLSDGVVTAEHLMERRLGAGLLALSGCVTGLARRQPGDELIGLTRAAAAAGIPSVVTSLWPVWDDSTRLFFDRFYLGLANGLAKDRAMLYAQQSLMEEQRFSHPGNWAAFVLFGDWN